MARVLLINDKSYRVTVNEVGDTVGIFEDSHQFSSTEEKMFEVLDVTGYTRDELEIKLRALVPEVQPIFKSVSTEWTTKRPEEKEMWVNPKDSMEYFLEETPKYPYTASDMSKETKDILKDPMPVTAVKDVLINSEFKETISRDIQNLNKIDTLIKV